MFQTLFSATQETALMIVCASLLTILIGIPVSILSAITKKEQLYARPLLHKCLNTLIEVSGSVPFLIIMVILIPIIRHVFGTEEGAEIAILPLTLAALPLLIRLCEDTVEGIPAGLIETFQSLGASRLQILFSVILPEALPGFLKNIKLMILHVIGYSAVAGALGAGGLGGLAIEKGFYAFEPPYILAILFIFILLVQVIEYLCDQLLNTVRKS